MKSIFNIRPQIAIVLALLAFVSVGYAQDIAKLERFMQSTKGNTASMQIFREGRDSIEKQNWQRAAEKFNEFITGYPKDKDLDAALYWYGYALQKQGRTDDAATPLLRLINRYPGSTWRNDAQALLVTLGRKADVEQALARDNCEIKILALQSLFQADEDRAVQIVTDSLKANTSQCEGFQAAALSLLGRHGGTRAFPILLDIARSNTADLKLRLTAIRYLGGQRNEQITGELVRIYDADKTKEVRNQVLRALADRDDAAARAKLVEVARQGETPELRLMAIRGLSDRGRMSLDELIQFYNSETNVQIKQSLLRTFASSRDPRALAKLFEIARGSDPVEFRSYAVRHLSEKDDEQTMGQLIAMYDAEQSQPVKAALMRAFGSSKQKVAVRKLMTIARNDSSMEMRKVAVRYLGESKDPEALKFLEELLK